MRRVSTVKPIAVAAAALAASAVAVFVLPPIIRFVAFLMSGNTWRALTGIGLILFILGLCLAALIGLLERRHRPGRQDDVMPGRRGAPWTSVWLLLLAGPACLLVALIASGAFIDIIQWSGDRVEEIRGAQSSS